MPEKRQVEARVPEKKDAQGKITQKALGPVTIEVDYASTLDEAKKMFGEEAILSNAFANWRVTIQGNIRSRLKAGKTQAEIQAELGASKMGVAQQGIKVDPQQAFMARFAAGTPEEQAEMLKKLKALAVK